MSRVTKISGVVMFKIKLTGTQHLITVITNRLNEARELDELLEFLEAYFGEIVEICLHVLL